MGDDRSASFVSTPTNQALNNAFTFDMAASKTNICRVDLLANDGEYPQNLNIEISTNGTDWTTVWSRTNNLARDIHAIFTPVTARYVRARITANGTQIWSAREFRIYQSAGSLLFSLGTINDYGSDVVFDENWTTLWSAMHDISDATGWHAWINPRTLALNFAATRGTDLSSTIKFEEGRNIGQFRHQRNLLEKVDKVWVLGAKLGEEQLYATAEVASLPSDYRERVFIASAITDETILQMLATKLKDQGVNVVGNFSGNDSEKLAPIIISMVNTSEAEVLFVAFGAPQQEQWIARRFPWLKTVPASSRLWRRSRPFLPATSYPHPTGASPVPGSW
jgi:hypothetical protein